MCEEVFHNYTEYERIEKFTRPKVLRLLAILRIYKPAVATKLPNLDSEAVENRDSTTQVLDPPMTEEMEMPVQNADPLQENVPLPQNENIDSPEALQSSVSTDAVIPASNQPCQGEIDARPQGSEGPRERQGGHPHFNRRRRPDFANRNQRNRDDVHQLCAIIFVERRTTAKLLYHLLKVCFVQSRQLPSE